MKLTEKQSPRPCSNNHRFKKNNNNEKKKKLSSENSIPRKKDESDETMREIAYSLFGMAN